ncbi:MAG: molybdate ABC transporter substrate-binding protein [Bacillota bacterium]|nr:molybdate ABC transporter substrate-binding protein [Bacillota bacterium]
MKILNKIKLLILLLLFTLTMIACGQETIEKNSSGDTSKDNKVSLTISAASSLKDAMEEIKKEYAKEKPSLNITYNFGSSGSLQQQIEKGAEVDIFISAAIKQMNALKDKGLIMEETQRNFLENKMVLIAPKNSSTITTFKDLSTDKIKKIGLGEPKSVPAGQYAEEVLTKLDILSSIKSKVVYGKDVKEVLTWVETENADAGMVYETDAKASDKVKVVAKAPDGSYKPIYYPAAVIKASKNPDEARSFINFLYSAKAKPLFEKYGFIYIEK